MTDRGEDEVKLTEEEIDRLLFETLEDYSSPGYMNNTNEQQNVDESVKLSEEEIDRLLIETLDDSSLVNTNDQENVDEFEEIERMKKENEELEELDRMLMQIERIKKQNEDQRENNSHPGYLSKAEEEEIERVLDEMAKEKPLEYMSKKEEEDWDEFLNSMMIKQEQPESSTKKRRYEFEPNVPKTKRPDLKAPELDPLQIAMEMVSEYRDFVSYLLAVLSEGRGNAGMEMEKWKKVIDRGVVLVRSTNLRLKRLPCEMERMAKDENLMMEYAFRKVHLTEIMRQLRDVSAEIEDSSEFGMVSDVRYAEKVLPNCLLLLRRSKEELSELIQVIEALKVIDKEEDDDAEYDEEMEIE